jgi:cyclic beta-1,2-glucan synthetase
MKSLLRNLLHGNASRFEKDDQEPLWAELFSPERLEQHARSLAAEQPVSDRPPRWRAFERRNADNADVLREAYAAISDAVRSKRLITPAADWLVNNFHVVEDQLRDIRTLLPRRFFARLPALDAGPLAGLPRVYGIAWAFVAHTDSRFDPELLLRFVGAYQKVDVLELGELWALPTVLRIVMIENTRRLAVRIVASMQGREQADRFADAVTGLATGVDDDVSLVRAGTRSGWSRAFTVQLFQRLRHRDAAAVVALQELSQRLAAEGTSAEAVVQMEIVRQAAADLSVRNLITSMRLLSAYEWPDFVEAASLVNHTLSRHPLFARMDFITRDRYRGAIEDLARRSPRTELEIANAVVAKASGVDDPQDVRADLGHWLIGQGRAQFERDVHYRRPPLRRVVARQAEHAFPIYASVVFIVAGGILATLHSGAAAAGVPAWTLWVYAAFALVPASDIALLLVNRLVTDHVPPRHLPRLRLPDGLDETMRTFVVMPTMLVSSDSIAENVRMLETHYLSNGVNAGDIHFALLTDWMDAPAEHAEDDERLLGEAAEAIHALNARYTAARHGHRVFYLFHRHRQWNAAQHTWMGWERKRGKLHEFNRLLRGATDTSFITDPVSYAPPPPGVRFVLTLDADSIMPFGVATELVGTLLHPLNRPRLDATGTVTDGYAILQPRVTPMLPTRRTSSWFQEWFSGHCGVDPYTFHVSDVYQDLFGRGSFTGKGMYEVDAFEAALRGRMPADAILSHDLLEGSYARCGFVSDVELFEQFPAHTEVAAARSHRWARGDWQLLPWIIGRRGWRLPPIARWKMFDNLRRTLVAPSLYLLLATAWIVEGTGGERFALLALITFVLPVLLALVDRLVPKPNTDRRTWLRLLRDDVLQGLGRALFQLAMLPRDAVAMLDAIVRTLGRLAIRRRLLEWNSAAAVQASASIDLSSFVQAMYGGLAVTSVTMFALLAAHPSALVVAAPFIVLWFLAPLLAWRASQPSRTRDVEPPTAAEAAQLRLIARQTWQYFADLAGPGDHHLPPDNLQVDPERIVAHRTSPTNIGMYLVSIVAAHEFGWLGLADLCARVEACLDTLATLPRHRGHFFNWTETTTLRALEPRYVSTVDSGNLAGCLIALSSAARAALGRPAVAGDAVRGLADDVALLRHAIERADRKRPSTSVSVAQLHDAVAAIEGVLATAPTGAAVAFVELERLASDLVDMAHVVADEGAHSTLADVERAASVLHDSIGRRHAQVAELAPWRLAADRESKADATPAVDPDAVGAVLAGAITAELPLAELPAHCAAIRHRLAASTELAPDVRAAAVETLRHVERDASRLIERLQRIARETHALFTEMDFRFLYDPARKLFSIGYQFDHGRLDPSYYDLLASEARLASFIAIAKHDVPPEHWFRLGRTLIAVGGRSVLVSWSGSMFEYLMPSLLMDTPYGSLLDHTCRMVVDRQIDYARRRGVPWGISESAYHERDLHLTFQYSTFGVPGLGLKRGLGEDLVIAPYATGLAAMYAPHAAAQNFAALEALGGRGQYGFYEALDFTRQRVPETGPVAVVRAYMAHHQGMTLVSLANVLLDSALRRRFHREPLIRASGILLQETRHRDASIALPRADQEEAALVDDGRLAFEERVHSPHLPRPTTQLMSNGRYAVMMTAAGSGYSQWRDVGVTRWREDPTRDNHGSFIYLRDTGDGRVWSAGYQPTCAEPERYDVAFHEDRVRIARVDGAIETTLDVIVSAEDDAEIRRITLRNAGAQAREIEITSYAEITLTPPAADLAHPAFSNLFVSSEFVPQVSGLVFSRRPRAAADRVLYGAHVIAAAGAAGIEFETDRARFLGRGRSVHAPIAVTEGRPLTNFTGAVLDPIASLRIRVRIAPGAIAQVAFATMIAATRDDIMGLADKYHDAAAYERASSLAWTHAQVQLHYLGIDHGEAHLYQQLANTLLYHDTALRPSQRTLQSNTLPLSGLWRLGISGDRPILLARIDDVDDRGLLRQLLTAHEYWNLKGLAVDLVLLNDQAVSYAPGVQEHLQTLVRDAESRASGDRQAVRGGVFVVRGDGLAADERILLHTAARAVVASAQGNLVEQLLRVRHPVTAVREPALPAPLPAGGRIDIPRLRFFNGLGGFTPDGREYVIALASGQQTPLPWINVVANADFGFQASESGAGFTWAANSRENQLTPWSNDPVSSPSAEVFYLRDVQSGALWTPTALPIRIDGATYLARFGAGYARFESFAQGIRCALTQFVVVDAPVKISSLVLTNTTDNEQQLAVTAYAEWSLGASRVANAPFIVTTADKDAATIYARNPRNREFASRSAFLTCSAAVDSLTCDRSEFLGRNGRLDAPAALIDGVELSGRAGAGLDPCAALQRSVTIPAGGSVRMHFILGQGETDDEAKALVARYRRADVAMLYERVTDEWDALLGTIAVETPDAATNLMLNRWLLYQTRACRLFARAGFYQAGGAYGFRDQLQDVMALMVAAPAEARAHIVRACAHQFPQGDVQHWWHPPSGRGVRTRFSDDRVFLPFVVAHYIETTGDASVLDVDAPFIEGAPVPVFREDLYAEAEPSLESAPVFEHCARALDVSLGVGAHGLPLMQGGDWNDGMNRVGIHGRGESVWLGWFLYTTLRAFAPIAASRGEAHRAETWLAHAESLQRALDRHAWDGAWFRRAYFDDGTPLGSAYNRECRIDSIAQSWAAISGAATPERARQAMHAVSEYLVKRGDDMVLLFTPPFTASDPDPGYIQGYLPGVRENGAQYTHAAAWCVIAYAMLGDGDRAFELFAMLNPINHASTRGGAHRYKIEPYVVPGDVYSEPPHVGRGGWSWYTGAAGWLYRAGIEYVLGVRVAGDSVQIVPCIPRDWSGYTVRYRRGSASYVIRVDNPSRIAHGAVDIDVDGVRVAGDRFSVRDDGREHRVDVRIREAETDVPADIVAIEPKPRLIGGRG